MAIRYMAAASSAKKGDPIKPKPPFDSYPMTSIIHNGTGLPVFTGIINKL